MEKGIVVRDGAIGDVVATRDAFETDEGGNARTIQLVDMASRQAVLELIRGISGWIYDPDALNVDSFPAELTDNLIDCGDKSTLIVVPEFQSHLGTVDITPIAYFRYWDGAAESEIPRILETKRTSVNATEMADAFQNTGVSPYVYLAPTIAWDVLGAKKIGLHITSVASGVKLRGGMI